MTPGARYTRIALAAFVAIATFICYHYTLQNQFTNWDDDFYATKDPYIKSLTWHNLKVIFTEDITKNNYHPLCMLSLAFNYLFAGLTPWSYYLTNIFFHIANAILVFLLFVRLGDLLKWDEKAVTVIAAVGSLWFGIHPMHVESVSWIAERKDVMYGFFYLAGLITYLRYVSGNQRKWYWITLLLFVASCLSKPMAVVFPLSLFCLDFLLQRSLSKKIISEKILFFVVSLACGSFAFYTQNRTGAIASFNSLPFLQRIMYASYGYIMYLSKFFNPTYLSTFYPYPYRYTSGYLPAVYYVAPFIALAILVVPVFIAWKTNKTYFRITTFGLGFFSVNLVFVLQFISCGAAIMADRYSYMAYVGLEFMVLYFLYEAFSRMPALKPILAGIVGLCTLFFGYQCYQRTLAWHNAETLLSDAIEKYPYRALLSYKWRGHYYFDQGEYDKALADYNVLVTLRSADASVLGKIARIKEIRGGMPPGATALLPVNTMPVSNSDMSYKAALDSSFHFAAANDSVSAFRTFLNAFRKNQGIERLYSDSSFKAVQAQHFTAAIVQYNILLKLNPSNPYYYFYRGVAMFSQSNVKNAITDWEVAVKMNTKEVQQSASYNLSVAYDTIGKDSMAVYYAMMARDKGYQVSAEFLAKLQARKEAQRRTHTKK